MKKKIGLIILFLLGLFLIVIPMITNYLYNIKVVKLEKVYDEIIDTSDKDSFSALNELLINENNRIFKEKQRSFINQSVSYEVAQVDLTKYGLDDKIIGFLEVPSVEIKLPIYLGANDANMTYGAVHLTGTSYPIGGNNTNSVLAAHRGYYKSLMFRHIDRIKIGDTLYIKNYNGVLEYKATKIAIISPTDLDKLVIEENKDMITLISCHPFPYNYQRYAVYFERV